MSCAISERFSWERCGFDASVGGIRRTREGSTFELCSEVLVPHGGSMGKKQGAPGGVSPRVDFATSNSVGLFSPDPDFQHRCGSDPHRVTRSLPPASRRRDWGASAE
jgi:hypothetical protein